MPRKEQFAFGVAIITAALAVILKSEFLAWAALVIGVGFILDIYIRDLLWGKDRPSWEEVQKMSANEYKDKVLRNPTTERWVNWIASGYGILKKQMRKLAREAVIFMLLSPLVLFVGAFSVSYHDAHKTVVSVASEPIPSSVPAGIKWEPIHCQVGEAYIEQDRIVWTCQNGIRAVVVKSPPSATELIGAASPFALYGIPIGFFLWILYRAIRFAIKG